MVEDTKAHISRLGKVFQRDTFEVCDPFSETETERNKKIVQNEILLRYFIEDILLT